VHRRFIVLATDGVWDYLKEEDVAVLVGEAGEDAHLAALNVVQTCVVQRRGKGEAEAGGTSARMLTPAHFGWLQGQGVLGPRV